MFDGLAQTFNGGFLRILLDRGRPLQFLYTIKAQIKSDLIIRSSKTDNNILNVLSSDWSSSPPRRR
jgi:hypothetical protein